MKPVYTPRRASGCLNKRILALFAGIWGTATVVPVNADFALNFAPNTTKTDVYGDSNGVIGNRWQTSCDIPGYADYGCYWDKVYTKDGSYLRNYAFPDPTPFRQESIYISSGANAGMWMHVMVGDQNSDWKQDVYIRMSGTYYAPGKGTLYWNSSSPTSTYAYGSLSTSGGLPGAFLDGGNLASSTMDTNVPDACAIYAGNACDPLGIYNSKGNGQPNGITDHRDPRWTGNGSGDPNRVKIRQVDKSDPSMYQEFLKDREDRKPLIYQRISDTTNGFESIFMADMRGKAYNDTSALKAGSIAITPNDMLAPIDKATGNRINGYAYNSNSEFVLQQTLSGVSAANFDISADESPQANPTAGRYIYTPGGGWVASDGTFNGTYYQTFYNRNIVGTNQYVTYTSSVWGKVPVFQSGTYNYIEGGFDHLNQNPGGMMDPAKNPCKGSPFC